MSRMCSEVSMATRFFLTIDPAIWRLVSAEDVPAGEKDTHATRYAVYERRATVH